MKNFILIYNRLKLDENNALFPGKKNVKAYKIKIYYLHGQKKVLGDVEW